MKIFVASLFIFWQITSSAQTQSKHVASQELIWYNLCEYDYDFKKCLSSADIITQMVINLNDDGTGTFHMLGDKKISFTIISVKAYDNSQAFAVKNQMGTEFTLTLFLESGLFTKCSLKANHLQEGLVFY